MSQTNKSTVREYNNKKECMWLPQSKVVTELPSSATIKKTAKEFCNQMDLGSFTIERNARDCHIQNDCLGV